MKVVFVALGALFGFLLSRGGATTYDYYAKLFLFQDLQLLWVIVTAIAVGLPLLFGLRRARARALLTHQPIVFEGKPMKRGLMVGALILGIGWGLAGACPGTVLVMLGEGKIGAFFTIIGICVGTWLHENWLDRRAVRLGRVLS